MEEEALFPTEEEEEEIEDGEEEEEIERGEALPGLSVKISNSTFSIEMHFAGIMPRKSEMEDVKAFLRDLLAISKDFHLLG